MLGQTFDSLDIARIAALTFIEILLSADNALILAVLSRALPEFQRRRALYIGAASAFVLRALALSLASFILHSFWIELLGAAYLIYLSIGHFVKRAKTGHPQPPSSFWKTVFLIEFFDLAFAFDSIIAGIAFIATPALPQAGLFHPKLWIVYAGGMVGLLFIRYAADLVSRLIDRVPKLERGAHLLVGLVGVKLALEVTTPPPGLEYLFWSAFVIILASSFFRPARE